MTGQDMPSVESSHSGGPHLWEINLVRDLARARPDHPALYKGTWTEWWREYDVFGAARTSGDDHALEQGVLADDHALDLEQHLLEGGIE